jgi:hypothetical protein
VFFTIFYLLCDYYDYLLVYVCVSCSYLYVLLLVSLLFTAQLSVTRTHYNLHVLCSNLRRNAIFFPLHNFRDSAQSFQTNSSILSPMYYHCLLPDHSQLVIYQSSYHLLDSSRVISLHIKQSCCLTNARRFHYREQPFNAV